MSQSSSDTAEIQKPPAPRTLAVALVLLSMIQLLIILDGTIANIALPHIGADLGLDESLYTWVITSYALMFGGFLLIGGRLGDRIGFRRVLIIGLVVVAVSSLLGGLAVDPIMLFIARGLQGLGAALAAPSALALISSTFPAGRERTRAFGFYAAMSGAGSGVGLLLGGWLTSSEHMFGLDMAGWRWTFLINVPVALVTAALAPSFLRESARSRGSLDILGALTSVAGVLLLVFGLTRAGEGGHGWTDPVTIATVAAGIVLLFAFVLVEKRSKDPLLPLDVVAHPTRAVTFTALLLATAAMFTMFFMLTMFIQRIMGLSALETGLMFLPLTLGLITGAALASRLATAIDPRWLGGGGILLAAFGMLMLSFIPLDDSPQAVLAALTAGHATGHDVNYWAHIFPYIALLSLGMGMVHASLTPTVFHRLNPDHAGVASAATNTFQQIGGAIGLAVLGSLAAHITAEHAKVVAGQITETAGNPLLAEDALFQATFMSGASTAYQIGAGVLLLAAILVITRLRVPRNELSEASPIAA